MGYQYDIFISYRRDPLTLKWISEHLVPLLKHTVLLELGVPPNIFVDDQLETGTTWPIQLGKKLGDSKLIIPLWTKTFLDSKWCSCEIGHMLEREEKCGFRTIDKPGGLIFPFIIHDGETIPASLQAIQQKTGIQDCFNVRMSADSPKAELLADKIREVGKPISDAIQQAPAWSGDWQIAAVNRFVETFHNTAGLTQTQVPKF